MAKADEQGGGGFPHCMGCGRLFGRGQGRFGLQRMRIVSGLHQEHALNHDGDFEEFGSTHDFCDCGSSIMRVWRGPRIIPDRSGDNRLVAYNFFAIRFIFVRSEK